MRRELKMENAAMPLSEIQERPIADIENQLGLPTGFLLSLYTHEDDWSFVIKSHAFLEAALTHLLAEHLGKEDLLPVFAYLETSNVRTGKLAFVKAFDLLDKGARRFIHTLSELRNDLVHEVSNVNFKFETHVAQLSDKERKEFIGAFDYAFVEVVQASQRQMDDRLRATLDRIVLTAPRLALVAGVAMIGLDIYFRNRGVSTPRQYVILLGEMVIKEWEALQDTPIATTP
jgi:hypothetical protein